ncbi:MAG: cysteine desulfurase-like protein [Tildeniella torsiva UHER 1998/13D]|nr:cysteine desulfurase-like protein [Tildeniella torsiva UHER 1998/13D]
MLLTHNSPATLDLNFVRQQFPALAGDWVFFDNAGGSQILKPVVDRITEFLYESNAQLGASYAVSQLATERVAAGAKAMATLINAADPAEVVLGPSTSALLRMLAQCFRPTLEPGDEIIVTNADHEANISPWVELEREGIVVKFWQVNPTTFELDLADLEALLTPQTRLVAVTHTSNVLGSIHPVRAIADLVHAHGALLCVDGVAFAPHRRVDVQALDVDFYTFSLYKVYGPHMALLYGKKELLLALPGYNHYFINDAAIPYKFQPGGSSYELSYSLTAVTEYFEALAQHHGESSEADSADPIDRAFGLIQKQEGMLNERLLSFLHSRPGVRIIGRDTADPTERVSTISFVTEGVSSDQIPPQLDAHNIGIRYGHFYALRLIEDLGLLPQQGVVRVSMVHYNTLEECDRLIEHLAHCL